MKWTRAYWVLWVVLAAMGASAWGQDEAGPTVVVAECDRFVVEEGSGWRRVQQDETYASHAYGAMWVTHGALLGADADSEGDVAVQTVQIPADGAYRVWSKYQAPPYFNFLHRVEIHQGGERVMAHDYGKVGAARLWSFSGHPYHLGPKRQMWFSWGMDHDAAEAPTQMVPLKQGSAEIRLITLANVAPAGNRYVDFIVLTTEAGDTFEDKRKWGQVKSPFMYEAIHSTPIYMRFKNTTSKAAKAWLYTHFGHFTWACGPKRGVMPVGAVAPGQWSPWFDINRIVELFSDEGLQVKLFDAAIEFNAPPVVRRIRVIDQ